MTRRQPLLIVLLAAANLVVCFLIGVVAIIRLNEAPKRAMAAQLKPAPVTATRSLSASRPPVAAAPRAVPSRTPTVLPTPSLALLSPVPPPGPAAWTYYQNSSEGFRIAVPPGWQALDMSPDKLKQARSSLWDKNPALAAELEMQAARLFSSGFSFFAYDTASIPPLQDSLTSANLAADPLPFPLSLDTYVQLSLNQLDQLKELAGPVMHRHVSLDAGEAELLDYTLNLANGPAEPVIAGTMQYIMVRDRTAYILTFTTSARQMGRYRALFEEIAQGWAWVGR